MLATLLADKGRKNFIRGMWDRLHRFPGGSRVFSRAVGLAAPYTATIDAHIVSLEAGRSEVTMRDRRAVRNHIDCVHAVALANLVELSGNVAVAYSLPDDGRFIVAKMAIEYIAKARGPLRAIATCPVPGTSVRQELVVDVAIHNEAGDEVTHGILTTLIGPKKKR